jgi:hypothetical protein
LRAIRVGGRLMISIDSLEKFAASNAFKDAKA